MAGTANIELLRECRNRRLQKDTANIYGVQMAISMCIGMLLVGGGRLDLVRGLGTEY